MLENIALITDLDGTALTTDKRFSDKDLAAIKELREAGGFFAVASGRGYGMAKPVIEPLNLGVPAVLYNGAAVYDFENEKFLWRSLLPEKCEGYFKEILEKFPKLSLEVLREQNVYVQQLNEKEQFHLSLGNVKPIICPFDEIPRGDWIKALLCAENEDILEAIPYVAKNYSDGLHWVMSGEIFYEALPEGCDKANGMKKLLEMTNNTHRFVVAMGDYYNDIEMIKAAHLGVAVSSGCDEAKAAADLVVGTNDESPIWQVVEYIKNSEMAK